MHSRVGLLSISSWDEADFLNVLRTGTTPLGERLDNEYMPWQRFKGLTDDELMAIWLYLSSLPALDTNR